MKKIKRTFFYLLFQIVAFAQVGWEDAAFGGGGGDFTLLHMIFLLIGIIFFIWFVFFSEE